MAISFSDFKELNSKINLSLPIELIECSVLIIHSDSLITCMIMSSLVPLRPLASLCREFLHSLIPPYSHCCIALRSARNTIPEGVFSSCGCSLTLTLTTSRGIWHGAGATKSWSSNLSLSCSWRISVRIRSNHDSGGWATRVIPFSLLVFSSVHYSNSARNHQCCYQEPFISASNWRQTHI